MKKIFLSIIMFVIALFMGISGAFAEDNYEGQPVFKIYNYMYDKGNDIYFAQSYGSAVYLGDNIIVTNNHVVLSEKGDYTGLYDVCETRDFTKDPVCFSSAKLLYVDKTKDLAYLKLEKKPKFEKKIEFSKNKIQIGDKIVTYGYPSNGGETITFTSGKISGYESKKYKIDANIDSGSSGGGAFDEKGKLIGITTSVVSGYTTLGYLVPYNDIENFLGKKGNITKITQINTDDFKNYLEKYHKGIYKNNISTDYIDIKNISDYKFKISDNIFDKNDELKKIYLLSETDNTIISISSNVKNYKKSKFTEEDYIKLSKILNLKGITEQSIFNNGKEYYYSLELNKKTKYVKISFYRYAIEYKIIGSLDQKDEIKNAVLLFFKNSKINNAINYNDTLFINGVKISKNTNFESVKYISDNNIEISLNGLNKVGKNTILQLILTTNKFIPGDYLPSFSEILKLNKKKFSGKNIYSDTFLNKNGKLFYYVKIKFKNFILYRFITESKFDGYWYNYSFNVYVYGNENVDSALKNLVNNLEFKGKEVFPQEDIDKENIKNISEITFNNNPEEDIYNSETFKNFKLDVSKKEALKILDDIIGDKLNISNLENKNSLEYKLKLANNNLSKTKDGKKYIGKLDKIILNLKTEKLKKVSKKIEKIDLSNPKFKKYKLLLEYIKYAILIELENRK